MKFSATLAVTMLAMVALTAGCEPAGGESAPAANSAIVISETDDVPEVLATIGDDEIRIADLPGPALEQLSRIETEYRKQRAQVLEQALAAEISNRLLAAEAEKKGMSVTDLVASETQIILEPTDADVEAWYEQNRARLGGRSLEQIREQIREHLRTEANRMAGQQFDARLREEYDVAVHLEPFRLALNNEGSPIYGDPDAPVTLVEFSDFECPFCSRFFPTLKRIQEEYGDRVNIVYRQFPLTSIHPMAFKASEASLCAADQDRFWEYHDLLFQEQDRLAVRDLKEKAGRLGLDQAEFDRCLDTGKYVEQVQTDQAEGRAIGVTGTPALFVNGIPVLGGAVAYDSVASALDKELARIEG